MHVMTIGNYTDADSEEFTNTHTIRTCVEQQIFSDISKRNNDYSDLRPWIVTANSDKKYMELNGATMNVNELCVTFRKTAFSKRVISPPPTTRF